MSYNVCFLITNTTIINSIDINLRKQFRCLRFDVTPTTHVVKKILLKKNTLKSQRVDQKIKN